MSDRNLTIGQQLNLPPVIGAMNAMSAAKKIEAMGDRETARLIRNTVEVTGSNIRLADFRWPWEPSEPPVYEYADHAFGFIPKPAAGDMSDLNISDARAIESDTTLRHKRIKVTLDRLRVMDYPGSGLHTVLFDFYAKHQAVDDQAQEVHFTQQYRVREGSGAGITGYPIFVGLRVGTEGVAFKCYTVNVKNDDDQSILGFMGSGVFKTGLELVNKINPALPIITGFATGIVEAFAHRNDNVPVQDFFMGLDFSGNAARAQLCEGSYVCVQVQEAAAWDWSKWIFKRSSGQIVSKDDNTSPIKLNYLVFSISKMED